MFGMSMTEIMIIAVVALLVLGPKELPNVAKTLGKTLRDLRRAGDDLKDTFERELNDTPKPPTAPPADAVAATREPPKLADVNAPPAPLPEAPVAAAPPPASTPAPDAKSGT